MGKGTAAFPVACSGLVAGANRRVRTDRDRVREGPTHGSSEILPAVRRASRGSGVVPICEPALLLAHSIQRLQDTLPVLRQGSRLFHGSDGPWQTAGSAGGFC